MGFSAILGLLMPIFNTFIERVFPDKAKQDEARIEMQKVLAAAQVEAYKAEAIENQAKKDIIVTELGTSWAGNWRAYLMLVCISIVAYNWVIVSFLNAFLGHLGFPITSVPVPTELWTLITVGLGGYIGKETMKTYSDAKVEKARIENPPNDKAFFDVITSKMYKAGITQEQVNVFNEALAARNRA